MSHREADSELRKANSMEEGSGSQPPAGLQSVLLHLEQRAGTMPRVMLQDLPSEGGPVVRPERSRGAQPGTAFHQYQILGEVARGGVGIVYKARDFDIGRDVAMKMLRDDFAQDPARVQRFLEEAQIAGQLQHPGILPVYAVGLRNKKTPYFTMKLIKGGTMSAILQERQDPSRDLRKYLDIFEHVCNAMAYAHARGVVHRDLKPANVLVGSYGEVQVMDWGMGKVIERGGVADERRSKKTKLSEISVIETVRTTDEGSQSIVGSVMGTPAYMAPEQAQGHVDMVDARTDVFALGGILCEILTGEAPYRSNEDYAILVQAARCKLDDAYERLDACGADPRLVELAKSCLVPAQRARPNDAGVLAKEIATYLTDVEERARNAQISAVKAEEREKAAHGSAIAAKKLAEHERRGKRLTMGLAGAGLALVLLGAGGWVWVQGERRDRAASTERAVSTHLDQALALVADAQAAPEGTGVWQAALDAAQKAEAAVQAGGADEALAARVGAVLAKVGSGEKAARVQSEAREKDRELVVVLEDLASRKGPEFVPEILEKEYAEAYETYGLSVDRADAQDLARTVERSAISSELVAGLDDWAWLRARYKTGAEKTRSRPSEVARRADRDAWRNRVRSAMQAEDAGGLKRLAASADVGKLELGTLHLLAGALGGADELEPAIALLREVVMHHPGDFWSNLHLGYWLSTQKAPEWDEAVRFYTAAVALRPGSARTLNNLGIALQEAKRLDASIDAYRRALHLDPTLASAWNNIGTALLDQKKIDAAIAAFDEAIVRQEKPAAAWYGKGNALLAKGDAEGAIRALREALKLQEDFARARQQLFAALAKAGRQDEAAKMARAAVKKHENTPWAHRELAHAELRRGDYEKAIAAFERAISFGDENGVATHDLGSAWAKLGMWDKARECYAKALEIAPGDPQFHFDLGWALKHWGAWRHAMRKFQDALDLDPTYAPAYDERGELFIMMGRYGEAETDLLRALEHRSHALYAHSHLGRLYGILRDRKGALQLYQENVSEIGEYDRAAFLVGLADSHYERGLLDNAYESLLDALRAAPLTGQYHEKIGTILAHQLPFASAVRRYESRTPGRSRETEAYFYNGLGSTYLRRGLKEDAGQAFLAARERDDTDPAPPYNLSFTVDLDQNADQAIRYVEAALECFPYYTSAHRRMGYVLGRRMSPEAAERAYREYVGEMPKTCRAYFLVGLGMALRAKEDPDAAVRIWKQAAALNQMAAALSHANTGAVHLFEYDDPRRAIDAFVQALEIMPHYVGASQLLGIAMGREMSATKARAAYERRVTTRPGATEAAFLVGLGQALAGEGNLEAAGRLVGDALALQPRLASAQRLRVSLLNQEGRIEEAMRAAHGFLEASPFDAAIRSELARSHWLAGDTEAALAAQDVALGYQANAPDLLLERARLLEEGGRWVEVLATLEDVRTAASASPGWANRSYLDAALPLATRLAPFASRARSLATRDKAPEGLSMLDHARLSLGAGATYRAAQLFHKGIPKSKAEMTGPVDATLREAAIAAIRTGLGRGEDARKVKNKERMTWRARGRAWLRQDLERLRSARKSDDFGKRALAVAELYMTLTHPELASVRDEAALAHLPDEEADAWRALWSDVRLAARP